LRRFGWPGVAVLWALSWLPEWLASLGMGASTEAAGKYRGWIVSLWKIGAVYDFLPGIGVVIAVVLLYHPVARKGSAAERQERRGEIFTGVLNLDILLLALTLPMLPLLTADYSPWGVAMVIFTRLMETATACLVGFHVCEGRWLTAIAGYWIASLAGGSVAGFAPLPELSGHPIHPFPFEFSPIAAGVAASANFLWQFWALVSRGRGFELYPTGLLRAVRRTAGVLVPVGLALWVFTGRAWLGTEILVIGQVRYAGLFDFFGDGALLGILVPVVIVFMDWPEEVFRSESRKLVLLASAGGYFLALVSRRTLLDLGVGQCPVFLGLVWMVFVPLCLLRVWSQGRYAAGAILAIIAVVAYGLQLIPFTFPEHHGGMLSLDFDFAPLYAFLICEPLSIVMVLSLLAIPVSRKG